MTRTLGSMLVLCLSILTTSAAYADEFTDPGGYITFSGITGFEQFEQTQGQDFDTTMGLGVRVGYRATPHFSFEIDGTFLSGWDFLFNVPNPGPGDPTQVALTLQGGHITGNAKAYLPIGRFQPYALFGLGGMWADVITGNPTGIVCDPFWWWCVPAYTRLADGGGFMIKYGGGLDLYLSDDFALVLEATYVMPFGNVEPLRYVNLAWGGRFEF